jgi:hypothetical protein
MSNREPIRRRHQSRHIVRSSNFIQPRRQRQVPLKVNSAIKIKLSATRAVAWA